MGEAQAYFRDVVLSYDGDECLVWPFFKDAKGYGQLWLATGSTDKVHRLVCEDVNGPAPSRAHQAAHSCGRAVDGCVTRRHLSWKTPAGNEADKVLHGTAQRGERQWQAKLTESDVRTIRELATSRLPQKEIAAQFGVTPSLVSLIHRRKKWAWLDNAEGRA